MSRFQLATTAAAVALTCSMMSTSAQAQDGGLYQPLLSDFHTLVDEQGDSDVITNQFIQFGKVFTGGFNYKDNDTDTVDDFFSAGVFFKPQLNSKDQLVIGASFVKSQDFRPVVGPRRTVDDQLELQVKYTLANSLSFAAGYYDNGLDGTTLDNELLFARFGYDVPLAGGKVTVSPLFQRQQDDDENAGLFAVYTNKSLLIGGGTDGEQARGVINFKFPEFGRLKPAAEVLRVDGTVGDIDATLDGNTGNLNGAKVLLATGTLDFSGGFLAQGNSVGRASGPSAVYYNNPVSFTSSAWNRGYDVWEYGKLANFRILSFKIGPNEQRDSSVVVYPMQIIQGTANDNPAKRIFVGYRHISDDFAGVKTDEPIIGYFGTLFDKFSAAISLTYDFDANDADVVLGLVYLH